jgi:hypothetical protein
MVFSSSSPTHQNLEIDLKNLKFTTSRHISSYLITPFGKRKTLLTFSSTGQLFGSESGAAIKGSSSIFIASQQT